MFPRVFIAAVAAVFLSAQFCARKRPEQGLSARVDVIVKV